MCRAESCLTANPTSRSCAAPILASIAPIKRRQPRLARYCEGNEYLPYYPYFFIRAERGDAERPLIFKLGKPGAEMLVDLFNQSQSPLWVARCHGFLLCRASFAPGRGVALDSSRRHRSRSVSFAVMGS